MNFNSVGFKNSRKAFVVGAAELLWPSFTMKAVGFPSSIVESAELLASLMAVSSRDKYGSLLHLRSTPM